MKKTTYLTQEQRSELIEHCLGWYEDWQATDPILYNETIEQKRQEMIILNNSDLIKHVNNVYCGGEDIFKIINP